MNPSAINTLFGIQATPAAAAKPASNSPAFGEMLSREMNVRQNASRPEPAPTGIRPAPPNSSNTPRPPERNQIAQGANQQAAAPQQEQPADRPASGDADQVQSADAQGAAATAATNAGDKAAKPGKKDKSDKTDKTDDRVTAADPTSVSSASAELLALVNSMLPRPAAVVDAATAAAATATAGGPVDPKAVLVKGAAVRLAGDPTAGVADHADGKTDPAFDALLAQAAHATSARNVARADLDTKGKQSAADGLPSARADTSLEPGAGAVTPGQAAAPNIRSDEPVIAAVQAAAGKAEPGIAIGTVALAGAIPVSLTQAAGSAATDTLTPHVGTPAWDHALGQKVVWMAAGAEQSASLTL
ncbi:MAG: hypothetical protein H7327_16495, partial [Herminiimonas sp.]|nr:hypothetical protein [Herminiimonas sp.]